MKAQKYEEIYAEFEQNIKFIKCPTHGFKISLVIGESSITENINQPICTKCTLNSNLKIQNILEFPQQYMDKIKQQILSNPFEQEKIKDNQSKQQNEDDVQKLIQLIEQEIFNLENLQKIIENQIKQFKILSQDILFIRNNDRNQTPQDKFALIIENLLNCKEFEILSENLKQISELRTQPNKNFPLDLNKLNKSINEELKFNNNLSKIDQGYKQLKQLIQNHQNLDIMKESKSFSENLLRNIKPENYIVKSVNQKYLGFKYIKGIHHLIDTRIAVHGERNSKYSLVIIDVLKENKIQFELEVSDSYWGGLDGFFTKFSKETFLIGNKDSIYEINYVLLKIVGQYELNGQVKKISRIKVDIKCEDNLWIAVENNSQWEIQQIQQQSPQEPLMTLMGHSDYIWNIQLYKDTHIFSCGNDQTTKIWDYNNGQLLKSIYLDNIVYTFIFNQKTNELIAATLNQITIYDLNLENVLVNQKLEINNVNFGLIWDLQDIDGCYLLRTSMGLQYFDRNCNKIKELSKDYQYKGHCFAMTFLENQQNQYVIFAVNNNQLVILNQNI